MKLLNIFKKETTSVSKHTKVQTLDKNQLAKVIGGGDGDDASRIKNGGKITGSIIVNSGSGL